MKEFNIEGACIKEMHYMVDISKKLEGITRLIDQGKYFTINRSRQYGKTTTISMIGNNILNKYIILKASIVIEGRKKLYNLDNQILNKASMHGIISEDKNEKVKAHNIIFEKRIYNYMISKRETV